MTLPPEFTHQIQNYMAIIIGYAGLLEEELAADDPKRRDVIEIRQAAEAATALVLSHSQPRP